MGDHFLLNLSWSTRTSWLGCVELIFSGYGRYGYGRNGDGGHGNDEPNDDGHGGNGNGDGRNGECSICSSESVTRSSTPLSLSFSPFRVAPNPTLPIHLTMPTDHRRPIIMSLITRTGVDPLDFQLFAIGGQGGKQPHFPFPTTTHTPSMHPMRDDAES